jgi:hypothetical protein
MTEAVAIPSLQIDRRRTRFSPPADGISRARVWFDQHHWLKLPRLIDGRMLVDVQHAVQGATFVEVAHSHVTPPSIDVCMEPNACSALLELLCNDPALLQAVEALTGCSPLRRFSGFVYRLVPGTGHHHNWHNDVLDGRRVAMSINLEPDPYAGGTLQIRERATGTVIEEVTNNSPGDAVLFRIDPAFQHRVLPVSAGVKTAFAGWFRSAEPLVQALRAGHA